MSSNNSGNQTFTRVVNLAAPIDELTVGRLNVASPRIPAAGEIVGYLPTGTGVGSYWLNIAPNAAINATTTYNSTTLVLPLGAAIQRVVVTSGSVDLVGGGNIDIGTQAFGTLPGAATNLLDNATSTIINGSGGAIVAASQAAFATAGTQAGITTSLSALTGITLTPSTAITAGGEQLIVRIQYVV